MSTTVKTRAPSNPINAAHAIVDEDTGLIMFKGAQSLLPEGEPVATYTFVKETGVFLDDGILPVADPDNPYAPNDSIQLHAGRLFVPLLPGVDVSDPVQLQQNNFLNCFQRMVS